MEIVELGLVREHQERGAGLSEATGQTDPVLPDGDQDYYQIMSHFEAQCQKCWREYEYWVARGLWPQLH